MMNELVSIIIPIYNDYSKVSSVLDGFFKQTYQNIEILLIDDGSENIDKTLIENYQKKFNNFSFYQHTKNTGRSAARNTGIENSSGNILVFNDADRIPGKNLVKEHVISLSIDKKTISIGEIVDRYTINKSKYFDRLNAYYNIVKNLYDDNGFSQSSIVWLTTFSGNMAVYKDNNVYFDEIFSNWGFEHFELGYRLKKEKYKFKLSKRAKNFHLVHERSSNFYKESIRNSCELFYKKHPVQEVSLLDEFILGNISLDEYETEIMGFTTIKDTSKTKYVIKIINF